MATKTKKTNKKKKKKQPSQKQQNENQIRAEALKKIVEHNRDYFSLKLTIPLGNPALKQVHTNQFLFNKIPNEFNLMNWTLIADKLNANTNRSIKFKQDRWYIEGVTINVEGNGKSEMQLDLNAFPSTLNKFSEDYKKFVKAYTDATTQTTSTKKADVSNAVSTGENTTLKGGWCNWVDNWVKNVCKQETDPLKKAKLIDAEFKRVTHWSYYYDAQKTKGNCDNYEKAYNTHYLNCADGANILCAFFNSAGINATCMHTDSHYIVRLSINGTYYWTDCSASDGQLCNKGFNVVYGYKGGSEVGKRITY